MGNSGDQTDDKNEAYPRKNVYANDDDNYSEARNPRNGAFEVDGSVEKRKCFVE